MDKKFALVSRVLPGHMSGQGVMIEKFMRVIDKSMYVLVTNDPGQNMGFDEKKFGKLAILSGLPDVTSFSSATLRRITYLLVSIWGLISYVWQLKKIVEVNHCGVIVACSSDLSIIPAAKKVCEKNNVDLVLYMMDMYSEQWPVVVRPATRYFERKAIMSAKAVMVPNEFLRDVYKAKYGIDSILVRNPVDIAAFAGAEKPMDYDKEIKIVYTGNISENHYDSVERLLRAIEKIDRKVELHLYTPHTKESLQRVGIVSERLVVNKAVDNDKIPAILMSAHILFLPLSFNPDVADVVNTSAPGKMGEYLAAQRPILAHSPKGSFVDRYISENRCGVIVNEDDTEKLKTAVLDLMQSEKLRKEFTDNAKHKMSEEFELMANLRRFKAAIGWKS